VNHGDMILSVFKFDGEMRLTAGMPEEWIDRVRPGLPAFITFDESPEKILSGVVADIAPLPDPIPWRKQYSVGVKIDKGFPELRPEMRATVKLVLDGPDDVLAVPVQAVAHSDGRDRVAYREADGEFTWCKVTTGVPADGFVEIVEGLQDLHGRKLVALDPQAVIREQARRGSPGTPDNPAQTIRPASTQESIQGKYHRVMKPASRQTPRPPAPGDR
jgi:multidrug efflux pump subunit AcrA (membrane-fusion protein)